MRYIRVQWKHQHREEPVVLYSELDPDRRETRKVEVFRDGHKGYASANESCGGSQLAEVSIPELTDIAADPQFEPVEITPAEFEAVWDQRKVLSPIP